MIIVDTGPLYAAADSADAHHAECARLFSSSREKLIVPLSVVVEASFLIERYLAPLAESAFLAALPAAAVAVEQLVPADLLRMSELVATYADMPLGAVDASIVAVAERLDATSLATLDRRHFSAVRPRHATAFTLLP